jgi:hypothetical protein
MEAQVENLECDCGNPACHATACYRRGAVFFTDPDGSQRTRNDYFYLDVFDWDQKSGESRNVELMMEPYQARALMWYLILNFMPLVSHVARRWQWLWGCYLRYWYWSIVDRVRKGSSG